MLNLLNHDAAFRYFRTWLVSNNFKDISPIKPMNKGRHALITTEKDFFYCLYKTAFFWKFPDYFKEFLSKYPNLNGAGESINVECLHYAFDNGFKLIYIYENGSIYEVEPVQILECHKLAKDFYINGLIRSQDKTNEYKVKYENGLTENVNEATITFPVKLLRRIN